MFSFNASIISSRIINFCGLPVTVIGMAVTCGYSANFIMGDFIRANREYPLWVMRLNDMGAALRHIFHPAHQKPVPVEWQDADRKFLYLAGVNILAAPYHHIFYPASNARKAIFIQCGQSPVRIQPSFVIELCVFQPLPNSHASPNSLLSQLALHTDRQGLLPHQQFSHT